MKRKKDFGYLMFLLIGVLFIWAISWFLIDRYIPVPEIRGQFGEKFGAINALFSGLALCAIVYSLIIQQKELTRQAEKTNELIQNNNLITKLDLHRRFQETLKSLQILWDDDVNSPGWKPKDKKEERAISLYWYLVFDGWFICVKEGNENLGELWTKYYQFGIKSMLKIKPFRDNILAKLENEVSFLGQAIDFRKEILRIDKLAQLEISQQVIRKPPGI